MTASAIRSLAMQGGSPPSGSGGTAPGAIRRYAGRRALVVEIDPETRLMTQEVLESVGFIVDAVDNGVEAVSAARQNQPALILMDMQLRDVGGLEVLLWLRANPGLRQVPVIAISVTQGDLPTVRHARIAVVMRKPLSVAAIVQAIEEAMGASG